MSKEKDIDIGEEIRVHIVRNYKTQTRAAAAWGISNSHLSNIINGKKDVPESIAQEVGFKLTPKRWVRIKKEGEKHE